MGRGFRGTIDAKYDKEQEVERRIHTVDELEDNTVPNRDS
jgi:hypothetical protein